MRLDIKPRKAKQGSQALHLLSYRVGMKLRQARQAARRAARQKSKKIKNLFLLEKKIEQVLT